jgi:hypothetical protein
MKVYIFSFHNLLSNHSVDTEETLVAIWFSLEELIFGNKSSRPGFCFSADIQTSTLFWFEFSVPGIRMGNLTNLVYLGKLYPFKKTEKSIQDMLDRFEPDVISVSHRMNKLDLILED